MCKTAGFDYFHKFNWSELVLFNMQNTLRSPGKNRERLRVGLVVISMACLSLQSAYGQFWAENFGFDAANCSSQGESADGFATGNGAWAVEDSGVNGFVPNEWYISATEGGVPVGFCNESCIDVFNTNRTLHLSENAGSGGGDLGAFYFEAGAVNIFVTDKRAVSPVIDCTGQFGIELFFDYIHTGSGTDFGEVQYFDGTAWQLLLAMPNSPAGCAPDRQWANASVTLPASANNNPDVQIGFRWVNNDDGLTNGGNLGHSMAVDNLALFSGPAPAVPIADFEATSPTTFCEGGCIQFNATPEFDEDFSDGLAGSTFEWSFPGGNPETSTNQNPVVCYSDFGSYDVTLTVTDNIGASLPLTLTDFITVEECGPVVSIGVNQFVACANEECFDFEDLSTGNEIFAWFWTFTSPSGNEVTSTQQNPQNICLTEIGFYDVTLEAIDLDGTTEETFPSYVEVIDCTGPEVDFDISRMVICPGDCVNLTDLSTSDFPIFAWNWTLPGGQAQGEDVFGSSTQQNPTVCYENPGTYEITLAAEDQEGVSAITKTIQLTVDPCTGPPQVGINSSATEICTGDCVDFFSESLGLVEEYLWVFQGVADINSAVSTEQNPAVICYDTPGTYNVTLTVSNSNGEIDSQVFTDYITVNQCVNPPVPRIELSEDTICAGKCVTFSNVSTGLGITGVEWNFQGGTPTNSTDSEPTVCYDNGGSFAVSLTVFGAGGDSTIVFPGAVTVETGLACRPQIEIAGPDTICAGDCAPFQGFFTDADSVSWTFVGGNPETSSAQNPGVVCFEEEGTYTIIVEAFNASGAATPVIQNIVVSTNPGLNAGPDQTVTSGATVTLTALIEGNDNPLGTFEWQPFDFVDDFRSQTVITRPTETLVYIVTYGEPGGCVTSDTVTVFVNFAAAVGVPAAFSPNGDGVNDQLRVLGQGIARMDFKVYNRYGQLVFETTEQSLGWDGTQNGRDLNPGNFVWVLDVQFAEGRRERLTGDVTLVR